MDAKLQAELSNVDLTALQEQSKNACINLVRLNLLLEQQSNTVVFSGMTRNITAYKTAFKKVSDELNLKKLSLAAPLTV